MGKAGSQKDRSSKKATKVDDEPVTGEAGGSPLAALKAMVMESCIVQIAPSMRPIALELKAIAEGMKVEQKEEKKEEKKEEAEEKKEGEDNKETDETAEKKDAEVTEVQSPAAIFEGLQDRLVWHNTLGLAKSSEDSKIGWGNLKGLEMDGGPRKAKRGNPAVERVLANFQNNLPEYVTVLLVLMVVRAFLFRSFFACLPWLCLYQFVSLVLPQQNLAQLPQVPLEKIPVQARVAATVAVHGLVWLFYLYEAVWRTYFLEKLLLVGLFAAHSYVVRPAEA